MYEWIDIDKSGDWGKEEPEGKTTGIKNLLFDSFVNSYWTVVPPDTLVDKFYKVMTTIQDKKQVALSENQKFAELRESLLPMLMNGQVK
jgi:type I restriction enzyme S subunit